MSDNAPPDPTADQEIFEHLFRQRHDRLLTSLTSLVNDRARAEDIAAIAFQTAWEKRAQFRGDSSLATWLYAISRIAAQQSWRKDPIVSREPMRRLETLRDAEPDRLSERLEQDELRAAVWKALERIPAESRQLLIDRYIAGRSVPEIAREEGVPEGTVLSRTFTAKRFFRQAWEAATRPENAKRQDIRQMADDALGRLAAALEAGHSDTLRNYLTAMSRFHHYSWTNTLLIHAQRPTATHVAGYHTWRELGRSVKRGEKGIMIYAPLVTRAQVQDKPGVVADQPAEEIRRVTGFRTAYVFDLEQTVGQPLPAFATTQGDPKEYGDKLKAIVEKRGIALDYDPSIAPADGISSGGRIRLRPGLSPAEEFSALAHELAHEMLHHGPDRVQLPKVVRETQAEAVAFVVSRGIGLETGTAAADYIALYNGDPKTLASSLAAVQEASSQILSELLPERSMPAHARTSPSVHKDALKEPAPREAGAVPEQPRAGPDPSDSISLDR